MNTKKKASRLGDDPVSRGRQAPILYLLAPDQTPKGEDRNAYQQTSSR